MHLIKLCVGIDSVEELAAWQAMRLEKLSAAGAPAELMHRTRQTPRRGDAVVESGSIYWVIKGFVRARQKILELREMTDAEGRSLCGIVLDHSAHRHAAAAAPAVSRLALSETGGSAGRSGRGSAARRQRHSAGDARRTRRTSAVIAPAGRRLPICQPWRDARSPRR